MVTLQLAYRYICPSRYTYRNRSFQYFSTDRDKAIICNIKETLKKVHKVIFIKTKLRSLSVLNFVFHRNKSSSKP